MNHQPSIHPLIKAIALTVFILLPFIGFYLGMTYQQSIMPINQPAASIITPSSSTKPIYEPCVRTGCSMQLCLSAPKAKDTVTTCEYKDEYACYQEATCERQANGACGWTETPELTTCLTKYGTQ